MKTEVTLTAQVRAHVAKIEARMGEGTTGEWRIHQDDPRDIVSGHEDDLTLIVRPYAAPGPNKNTEINGRANARNIAYRHNTWAAEVELVRRLLVIADSKPAGMAPNLYADALRADAANALQSWLTDDKARYEEVYGY